MIQDYQTKQGRLKKRYPIEPNLNEKINVKDILAFILSAILVALLIDIFGYVLWKVTGQTPQDSFFIGAITNIIIN